jgi:hypothetical protein
MAVELTTEQSERLERVLRGISDSMSPQALQELRERITWDATHPRSAEDLQKGLEQIWSMVGDEAKSDTRTLEELLGYDGSGLPT